MNIDLVIRNFKRNNIKATLFENKDRLIDYLKEQIPHNSIVGVGDSVTLETLGIYDLLREGTYLFLDKYNKELTKEEKRKIYIRNFDADFFISGANAISADGCIFNLDGNGSRVAPMLYGPRKVYVISGTNKIVADEKSAVERIKTIAAPLDNVRCNKSNPCVKIGHCVDCKSKQKICNYFTKIQGQFNDERIELLLIEGDYGY